MKIMVETVEYIITFGISSVTAAFSILLFFGVTSQLNHVSSSGTYSQISSAVDSALSRNASTSVTVSLVNATIRCEHGSLVFESYGDRYISFLPANCNFSFRSLTGVHTLTFSQDAGSVRLKVDK